MAITLKKIEDKELVEKVVSVATGKSVLAATLKATKDTHYNFHERKTWQCSTGSFILDALLGPISPGVVRLCGPAGSGKSSQALEILRNFLISGKNRKGVWVLAEGRGLSEEMIARCGLKFVYDAEEWEDGTVFILETNIFETFIKVMADLSINNPEGTCYGFVLDSVDGLILEADSKKEIDGESKVAGVPALSKKMFQKLSVSLFKRGHFLIAMSQVTSDIKINPYAKQAPRLGSFSGGSALNHAADWIIEYGMSYKGDFIMPSSGGTLDDGKTRALGRLVKVTILKSVLEKSKLITTTYPIKFGRKPSGIWLEREIGDMLFSWGKAVKKTSWITMSPDTVKEIADAGFEFPEKIQGEDNFYQELENHPEIVKFYYEKFKAIL